MENRYLVISWDIPNQTWRMQQCNTLDEASRLSQIETKNGYEMHGIYKLVAKQ